MAENRIITDGDPIPYTAGAGSEKRIHHINWVDANDKEHYDILESDPREFVKKIKADGGEITDRELEIEPRPWSFCEVMVRSMVHGTERHCAKHLGTNSYTHEIILSGKTNFRNDVATVTPYKGSRAGKLKPHWYTQIREMLVDSFGAEVIEGIEADDEVSIRMNEGRQWGDHCILSTIDKDLDQIIGKHWDNKKKVFYMVGAEEATFLLYSQILSGDPTDDIPGAMGLGPGKAQKLIGKWQEEYQADSVIQAAYPMVELYLWDNIVQEYSQRGSKGAFPNLFPEALAIEQARLVNLQSYRGQLWTPPGHEPEDVNEWHVKRINAGVDWDKVPEVMSPDEYDHGT
jgi:hypothetical protein